MAQQSTLQHYVHSSYLKNLALYGKQAEWVSEKFHSNFKVVLPTAFLPQNFQNSCLRLVI